MISILMPLYNGIEFIDDSLGSILGQSIKDWELLIGINGHDPDEEYDKILEKMKSIESDKVKYTTYIWKSKVKTLNALIEQAQFDKICLIDVDDYWFPEKLKKQLAFIDKYDVVGTDATYFGDKIGTPGLFQGKIEIPMFSFQNPIINSSVMFKKEDAKWDESWEGLDDYSLWVHLMRQGKTFYNVPEILIGHRLHEKSYFNNKNEEMRDQLLSKLENLSGERRTELENVLLEKKWVL